ncbi:MAG: phosphomannomutase/phosphoglucomutase, partial [Betaproteobacteria bacterium]
MLVSPAIFKAYDIRGIVDDTLTESVVEAVGFSLAREAGSKGISQIVVGRDGRLSGPRLVAALSRGICSAGLDVVDLGQVTTPVVYFGTNVLHGATGVAVTGSHNPPNYNGLKMVLGGAALYGEAIQKLRQDVERGAGRGTANDRRGAVRSVDVVDQYLARVTGDVKLTRPMRIAIDCGNGVAGALAPRLFRELGCEVTELFCEVDGNFPNHHPDPAHPENLQ